MKEFCIYAAKEAACERDAANAIFYTMFKKFFCYILCLGLLVIPQLLEAAPITAVRSSTNAARVRLVLDSKDVIKYKATKTDKLLILNLTQSSCTRQQPAVKDSLLQSVVLAPTSKNASQLQIKLSKDCQYQVFALTKPNRLVIDFYKVVKKVTKENVVQGVTYSFIQDELNGRQYQAYVVSVDPKAPYALHPFSAAGAYNGRGSVAKRAAGLNLPVAMNASYFDSDGWVIGTTKDNGQMLSCEGVPRSAYVSIKGRSAIVKDVAYNAYVELKNGQRVVIQGMNRARLSNDCVLYNEAYAKSTRTKLGKEIKIKNGRIIGKSATGNMSIEPGTTIISAQGASARLLAGAHVGDKVKLVEDLSNTAANKAEIVVGAGPMLLENSMVNVRTKAENIAADIANGRAPRTAVGVKTDGTLLMVVVDGRSSSSCGMTLTELAQFFQKLGAKDAVNFDGGGSSEMVIKGKLVNHPSDGSERRVSMGIGLFAK